MPLPTGSASEPPADSSHQEHTETADLLQGITKEATFGNMSYVLRVQVNN